MEVVARRGIVKIPSPAVIILVGQRRKQLIAAASRLVPHYRMWYDSKTDKYEIEAPSRQRRFAACAGLESWIFGDSAGH